MNQTPVKQAHINASGFMVLGRNRVKAISFTGGSKTGEYLARTAAPMFKKLSLELGAVFAGFLLAETEYATFIESQIIPVKEMLLCIFFMTIGMFFPFQFAYTNMYTCLLLFFGIMVAKFTGLYAGHRLILNNLQSIKASLMLLSIGEVVFIFINRFPNRR